MPCGGWELVASFAEEVAAIAEPLRLSDHKRDQRIASAVRPTIPSNVTLLASVIIGCLRNRSLYTVAALPLVLGSC